MFWKHLTAFIIILAMASPSGMSSAEPYVFPIEPSAITLKDISMIDAVAIAKDEIQQQQGSAFKDFENYNIKASCVKLESNQKAWVIMFDELFCGLDALVTIDATDGSIIDYQTSDTEITAFLIKQWTNKKGSMQTWSLEDKALFNWMFGSAEQYVLPTEKHISKEQAADIALKAIPEQLSSPEFTYAFNLVSYTDGRADQYVWMITVLESHREKYLVYVSAVDGAIMEIFTLYGNG